MAAPRVVFYAVNGLGLGHVTRLLAIARALRRLAPQAEILFITSSEADGVIYREGFAAVKLPSKTIREACGLRKTTYLKMAQSVTWNAIGAFDPDVLVVDTYPSGSFEELIPVLRWRQKNVFVFREQRRDSFQSELLAALLPLYDRLIVPHETLEPVGDLPEPAKARAVGPILIRERHELLSRARARAALGLSGCVDDDTLLIYCSFGGGGEPESRRALDLTRRAVAAMPKTHLVIGQGPLLLTELEPGANITVIHGRYPMMDVLPAFDAAVTAAGYNTVHELLFAGVASVLVPFSRILDDQGRRAHALAQDQACLVCDPLTESGLTESLAQLADNATRLVLANKARAIIQRNGATAAAQSILELL